MPEYDFAATMREEVEQLRRELVSPEVGPALTQLAARFGTSEAEALAAMWRASKRHGESIAVFAGELQSQLEREEAAAGEGRAAEGPAGAAGTGSASEA